MWLVQHNLRGMVEVLEIYRRAEATDGEQRRQLVESARELTELIDLNHTIANFEETFSARATA